MKKLITLIVAFVVFFSGIQVINAGGDSQPKGLIDFVEDIRHLDNPRKKYPIDIHRKDKIYEAINIYRDKLQVLENIKICNKCRRDSGTIAYVMNNGNTVFIKDEVFSRYTISEFYWILVHEFAHVVDFKYFQGKEKAGNNRFCDWLTVKYGDKSMEFYSISWDKCTKRSVEGNNFDDFVTNYARRNAFEDLAESVTFYVRNNRKMKAIAFYNEPMRQKYNWIRFNIFDGRVFYTGDNKISLKERTQFTYTSDQDAKKFFIDDEEKK